MIKLENVGKIYSQKNVLSVGLRKINLELNLGEFVAITGESGSGKSTLLNVICGIDSYEEGEIYFNGEKTSYYTMKDLEEYRKKNVAFVFQSYNLIESMTVLENVEIALLLEGYPKDKIKERAKEILDKVGLSKFIKHKASKLSGGQKQRVVIARALAKDAPILACDEPTGNLDSENSKEIIKLLHEVSKDKLVLIVTHDYEEVKEYATRKIRMFDGEIKEDIHITKPEEVEYKNDLPHLPSLKDEIGISFKYLKATPKKSIFTFLIYFLLCTILSTVLVLFISSYRNASTNSVSFFNDKSPNRMIVRNEDKSPLTEERINEIKSVGSIEQIVKKDYMIDDTFYVNPATANGNLYFSSKPNILSEKAKSVKLSYGRLPENKGEVIVGMDQYDLDILKKQYSENKNIILRSSYNSEDVYVELTIVGCFLNSDYNEDTFFYNTIFLQEEDYYELANKYIYVLDRVSIYSYNYVENTNKLYLMENPTLSDKEIKTSIYLDNCSKLEINDFYFDLSFNIIQNTYSSERYGAIEVSSNVYAAIQEKITKDYQVSIYIDDEKNVNKVKKQLVDKGFNVVATDDFYVDLNFFDKIQVYLYVALFIMVTVASGFITYLVLRSIIKGSSTDFAIFRTIGASKKNLNNILVFEHLIIAVLAFLFSRIVVIGLYFFKNRVPVFEYYKYLSFGYTLLICLLMMLISLFVTFRYTKKHFEKSVYTALRN